MTRRAIIILIGVCVLIGAQNVSHAELIPPNECIILQEVAEEYNLNEEETLLLLVIRKVENGGDGIEMGVLTPQARRFKGSFKDSLRLQGEWAAGTIKKRYKGNLRAFADRWCPVGCDTDNGTNKYWYDNALYYMGRG